MPTRAVKAGLCGWLALASFAALAAPSAQFTASFRQLQAEDARLNSIGFRLTVANAKSCAVTRPTSGLLLTDAATYTRPQDVRDVLGIKGDIAVQAVAAGSPAERAGVRAGAEVFKIAEMAIPAGAKAPRTTDRLNRLHGSIDAVLLARHGVPLELSTGPVSVGEVTACKATFELTNERGGARAGSVIVQVSDGMMAEAQGDDEAAFVVAHELAHVVLGHSRPGRTAADRRYDEREADRLAPWLMANAGYDPKAGVSFLKRWGAKGLRIIGDGAHDSPLMREKRVEMQIEALADLPADADGKRDWRPLFGPAKPVP